MSTNGRHHDGSGRASGQYGGLRLVAAGGRARSSTDDQAVVDRFMASDDAIAMSVPPARARALTASLVQARRRSESKDPRYWDPETMRALLDDWSIGGFVRSLRDALHVIDVVARFVRFADSERHVPRYATNETLAVLVELLRSVCGDVDAGQWYATDPPVRYEPYHISYRRQLYEEIGGAAAVEALDDRPLADEPFDWRGLEHAERGLVADVLRRADDACTALLDVEMRTLCRRGLAALVRHDRALFHRSQRTDVIAAGLVWATLHVNEMKQWLDPPFARPQQLAVAASMGVSSGTLSGRASSIEYTWSRAGAMRGAANRHSARRRAYLAALRELEAEVEPDELHRPRM